MDKTPDYDFDEMDVKGPDYDNYDFELGKEAHNSRTRVRKRVVVVSFSLQEPFGFELGADSATPRILKVRPGSQSEKVGLSIGDLILEVNGKPLSSSKEVHGAVMSLKTKGTCMFVDLMIQEKLPKKEKNDEYDGGIHKTSTSEAEEEERCCNRTCVLFSGTELVMHVIIYAIMMIFFFFHFAVGIAEEEANQMMRDTGKKLRKMVCGKSRYSIRGFVNFLEARNVSVWENLGPQSEYIDDDAQSEYIDDDEMNENYVDFFFPDLNRTLNACENDAEWTSHVKSYFLEEGSSTTTQIEENAEGGYEERYRHNQQSFSNISFIVLGFSVVLLIFAFWAVRYLLYSTSENTQGMANELLRSVTRVLMITTFVLLFDFVFFIFVAHVYMVSTFEELAVVILDNMLFKDAKHQHVYTTVPYVTEGTKLLSIATFFVFISISAFVVVSCTKGKYVKDSLSPHSSELNRPRKYPTPAAAKQASTSTYVDRRPIEVTSQI